MATCRKCGEYSFNSRICSRCLGKWTDMRSSVFVALIAIHGDMTPTNHEVFKKEMKRMENIWKRDKEKFQAELEKLTALSPPVTEGDKK